MLISIDPDDPRPIYLQIAAAIKQQRYAGQLTPGDELPSVRELAEALGVNLHTVRHAYRTLADDGVVRLGLARRARILPPPETPPDNRKLDATLLPRLREIVIDAFHLGAEDKDLRALLDRAIRESRKGTRP
jgi:DNA-binding transcriptional regulator YhcF (GntR family)